MSFSLSYRRDAEEPLREDLAGAGEYWFMGGELCDSAIRVDRSERYVQSEMMEVQTWTPNWHNESSEATQLLLSTVIDKNWYYPTWRINICIINPY